MSEECKNSCESEIRKLGKEIRQRYGISPCRDAGISEARYICPNSGIGGCIGQWGNCNYDFVSDSKRYRELIEESKNKGIDITKIDASNSIIRKVLDNFGGKL